MNIEQLILALCNFNPNLKVYIPNDKGHIDFLEESTNLQIVLMDETEDDGSFVTDENDKIKDHKYQAAIRIF